MRPRVTELFHALADMAQPDRARFLAERGIDGTTRREVEALLAHDSPCSLPLGEGLQTLARQVLESPGSAETRCGPYRLGTLLGRGGMGAVYCAERVDGEVAQQVAVKLVPCAPDDSSLRERFLAERQILAGLSHPNIARLLDAGHREDGQPYLVMERVEGQPLDRYAAHLGIRQKVELFLKVCAAVSYLHRNLIVHRDLKPSNILVTSEGEPKLLDFGIAKMLNLTTESTITAARMMTPEYASPEQVIGGPVTTATDQYSLGAVLYRILTGVAPHRVHDEPAEAVVASILNGKIALPSERMPALKGDLETILMKALRKEPQERYGSVEQFAGDLGNFLASRPVRARQGDACYRARKFLRRYWLPAAVATLVVASLVTGLAIADRQRRAAERRFAQMRQLANRMIDFDTAIRALPGSIDARQRLVAVSLEYIEGLSREAAGNADLAAELADAYHRMSRIQGGPAEFSLGDAAKAEQTLLKSRQMIGTVLAARPRDRAALIRAAFIAQDLMILADRGRRPAEARGQAEQAARYLEAVLGNAGPESVPLSDDDAGRVASVYSNLALMYVNMRDYRSGAAYAKRGIGLAAPVPSASDIQVLGLSVLANSRRYQGDLDGAYDAIVEARELSKKTTYPSEGARILNLYGMLLREGGILGGADAINLERPAEAVKVFEEALELTEAAARRDARDSTSRTRAGTVVRELGAILQDRDPRRALEVYDLGIRRLREADNSSKTRRDLAELLASSSYPLRRLGRRDEAGGRISEALRILGDTRDYPARQIRLTSPAYAVARALADREDARGDVRRALQILSQLHDAVMASNPDPFEDLRDARKISDLYAGLAGLQRRAGGARESAALEARRAGLWRHWRTRLPGNPFIERQLRPAS